MADKVIENRPWLWRPPQSAPQGGPKAGYIGKHGLRPKEASEKVTGRAIYTSDIDLPGMLHLKVYRSPFAHARIKSLDSARAEALPGVWAVVRYDDKEIDLSDPFKQSKGMFWFWWRDSILPDTADAQGARVGAMVVAESEEICDEALRLIGEGMEWEQLPVILDPEEAARPDAPLLHPELNAKSNVWKDMLVLDIGNVEQGFAESDHVIEFYESKRDDDVWAGVEPGSMVARWNGDSEIEFWYHGQFIQGDMNTMIAPAYKNEPPRTVKLKIHLPYNGGSFGGNTMGMAAHIVRYVAIAARKTGRPVKMDDDYTYSWEGTSFEVGTALYRVGFNSGGEIKAIKITTHQKAGLPLYGKFIDSLKTPNVQVREIRSYWNRPHESCWRDGAANCAFVNLIVNKVAAYLKMDPIQVQLLNDGANGRDMAWLNEHVKKPNGMPARDSLREVIDAGKKAFDWDNKWHSPGTRKLPNGRMHGVGFYAVTSWDTGARTGSVPCLSLAIDGTATIFFRRADCGQSAPTTYCQIVADEIGLRYEDVKIEFIDFTCFDAAPPGGSSGSSVNTYGLVVNSRKMKKLLLEYVFKDPYEQIRLPGAPPPPPSPFTGKTPEDLDIKDGVIFEKANPANNMPLKRLTFTHMSGMRSSRGPFIVGDNPPDLPKVEEKFFMGRQCCFIEVEVDTGTGEIVVTRLVHPYDVGQSLNPDVNQQQLLGGAYAGLGVSSAEAIYYDPRSGVRLNDNLIGYPVLTMLDAGTIEAPVVESHLGWSAYGLFGCSEAGKAAVAAALLVPAVYNAIGKWIEDTPVTPDKVLKALGKA